VPSHLKLRQCHSIDAGGDVGEVLTFFELLETSIHASSKVVAVAEAEFVGD
jgi:hypothetical protein